MNVSPLLEARYFSLLVYKCFRPALRACRGGAFFPCYKNLFRPPLRDHGMGYYIYFFRGIFSLSLRARYFLCADKESTQRKLPRACQAFVAYWLYSGALSHSASLPHGPGSASCLAPVGATCVQPNAPHGNRKGAVHLAT